MEGRFLFLMWKGWDKSDTQRHKFNILKNEGWSKKKSKEKS